MKIISRTDALASGLKLYFTGLPCRNGHIASRRTRNGDCLVCQNERTRRIRKRWKELGQPRPDNVKRGYHPNKVWREKYPNKWRAQVHRRRARERNTDSTLSGHDIDRVKNTQTRCYYCKRPFTKADPRTLDHVIALADGGKNSANNIVLAHRSCNSRKGATRLFLI